jgi:hypothetical protein
MNRGCKIAMEDCERIRVRRSENNIKITEIN